MDLRTCYVCGKAQSQDEFYKGRAKCRTCRKKRTSDYQKENIETIRIQHKPYYSSKHPTVSKRLQQRRNLIAKIKSAPCQDCSGIFPPECMDFDHRDRAEKQFAISSMRNWSDARVLGEIAKCDLICANCHRIRTAKQLKWRRPIL